MKSMNEKNEGELIQNKVDYFFSNAVKVHCSYRNGFWKRGIIVEVSDTFFILDEVLEEKIPVFFQELKDISAFRKPGEEGR
jgi:hypothetical protein